MLWNPNPRQLAAIKGGLFLLLLLPLASLLWAIHTGDLGPRPDEFVERRSGLWTLNMLLLTLAISPLRALTELHWLIRLRRMAGLICFGYATLHFLAFVGFEHHFSVDAIAPDILKRTYVGLGFAAFLVLIPLAATSSQRAVRWLGGRRWQKLHRNIYLASILATLHFLWLTRLTELYLPLSYAMGLLLLLGWRVFEGRRRAVPAPRFQNAKPVKFFRKRPD